MNREIQLVAFQLGWLIAFILVHYINDLSWWAAFVPSIALMVSFAFAFLYGFFSHWIRKIKK